jgi:hypothetical protein
MPAAKEFFQQGVPMMKAGASPTYFVPVYLVNGASGGTSEVDETAFAAGVTAGTPIMGEDPLSGELLIIALAPGTRQLLPAAPSVDEALFTAGVSRGTPIMGEDPTSGELLIVGLSPGTRSLAVAGSLAVTPQTSNTSTAPSQTTVGTSAVQLLAANALRKGFSVQNNGTTVIKLTLSASNPTQANYHVSLPACGVANDGSSPVYDGPPGVLWTGAVQAISSLAGGLVSVTELT